MLRGESSVAYLARICGSCGWRIFKTSKVQIVTDSIARKTVAEFDDWPQAAEFLGQIEAALKPHLRTGA